MKCMSMPLIYRENGYVNVANVMLVKGRYTTETMPEYEPYQRQSAHIGIPLYGIPDSRLISGTLIGMLTVAMIVIPTALVIRGYGTLGGEILFILIGAKIGYSVTYRTCLKDTESVSSSNMTAKIPQLSRSPIVVSQTEKYAKNRACGANTDSGMNGLREPPTSDIFIIQRLI